MKTCTRLALLAGASVAALALAGPALAAFTPKLDVSVPNALGATGKTTIHFSVPPSDDGTAKITIYTPKGFTANPGSPGSTLGEVAAQVRAADLAGAIIPVTGTVEVRDASGTVLVGGVPVPLAAVATACTGSAAHTAFWVLKLSTAGQNLELATFFDAAAGPETAFASYKLQVCLPADDLPPGTPGRAPFGIKLTDARLTLTNVYGNPSAVGQYTWISIWTPYTPGAGTANAAGTVEARSINGLPVRLTLKGTFDKKKKQAKLSGQITAGGQFRAGVTLPLLAGTAPSKLKRSGVTGPTSATGLFTAARKIIKTTYFAVRLAVPAVDFTQQGGCAPPALAPAGCVSATIGPFTIQSNVVKVVPKK